MNKYKLKDAKCEKSLLKYLLFSSFLFQLSQRDSLTVNCQLSTFNSYKYQFIYTMVVIIPYFSSENKGYKLNVV